MTQVPYAKVIQSCKRHATHAKGWTTAKKLAANLGVAEPLAAVLMDDIERAIEGACFNAIRDFVQVDMTVTTPAA